MRRIIRQSTLCIAGFFLVLGWALGAPLFSAAPPYAWATSLAAEKAALASRSLLLDGASIEGALIAVGEQGNVLISEDNGRSWRQASVPTQATLTGVFFYDRKRGWAVGHDATILRSCDGGETWEQVYCAPERECPLLDVYFLSASHGFAVGAYGLFLETSDGGTTWRSRQISENDFHLNHLTGSPGGRLFLAAEAGTIYRSDDQGAHWSKLPSPYEGSFFATLPLSDTRLLLLGLRGHLYRSEDRGENWELVPTGTQTMLTDAAAVDEEKLLVVGLGGTLLVSNDGGRTFTPRMQPDRKGYARVLLAADGAVILIGEFGVKRVTILNY